MMTLFQTGNCVLGMPEIRSGHQYSIQILFLFQHLLVVDICGAQVAVSLVCLEGSRNAPQIALLPNVADGSKLNPGVFAQF